MDICIKSEQCDTLGLARLGAICNPIYSCSIAEDSGLTLALTIAHELGHSLNAEHDTKENGCGGSGAGNNDLVSSSLMNSHLSIWSKTLTWSECSRNSITQFLDTSNNLKCLDKNDYDNDNFEKNNDDNNVDASANIDTIFSPKMPGLFYDFDQQCKFSFGINASFCKKYKKVNILIHQ